MKKTRKDRPSQLPDHATFGESSGNKLSTNSLAFYLRLSLGSLAVILAGLASPLILHRLAGREYGDKVKWLGLNLDHVSHYAQLIAGAGAIATIGTLIFAAVATMYQLAESERQTRQLNATFASDLLLPIFMETRSEGFRDHLIVISSFWRHCIRLCGHDPIKFIGEIKTADLGQFDEMETNVHLVHDKMTELFSKYRSEKNGEGTPLCRDQNDLSPEEGDAVDKARRAFSVIAQRVYQIHQAGLTSPKVLRISAFADFVATYRYCVYPLDLAIERERRKEADSYPPGFVFSHNIYNFEELRDAIY